MIHKGFDKLIAMAGLGLCIWGGIHFVQVPVEVLRAHPFSSILWLAALCSLMASVEAVEERQPWGLRAAVGMLVTGVLAVVANAFECSWTGRYDEFLLMVPRLTTWMTFILIVLFLRLLDQRKAARAIPIPRPVPHP